MRFPSILFQYGNLQKKQILQVLLFTEGTRKLQVLLCTLTTSSLQINETESFYFAITHIALPYKQVQIHQTSKHDMSLELKFHGPCRSTPYTYSILSYYIHRELDVTVRPVDVNGGLKAPIPPSSS